MPSRRLHPLQRRGAPAERILIVILGWTKEMKGDDDIFKGEGAKQTDLGNLRDFFPFFGHFTKTIFFFALCGDRSFLIFAFFFLHHHRHYNELCPIVGHSHHI